jgi:hypothetical protein
MEPDRFGGDTLALHDGYMLRKGTVRKWILRLHIIIMVDTVLLHSLRITQLNLATTSFLEQISGHIFEPDYNTEDVTKQWHLSYLLPLFRLIILLPILQY